MDEQVRARRLERLRGFRIPPERDQSLAFIQGQFDREVKRPHAQVKQAVELWAQLVPAELAAHTRLESLTRGTLKVVADSSTHLYELDRLLRGGVEQALIRGLRTSGLRRVKVVVGGGS